MPTISRQSAHEGGYVVSQVGQCAEDMDFGKRKSIIYMHVFNVAM